eukprot:3260761-Prymnesium_polylepis.1
MKQQNAWILQLRQILFEQRVVGVWMGHERLCVCAALHRWLAFSTAAHDAVARLTAQLEAERARWADELGCERALGNRRGERDAALARELQDRLGAAEDVASRLRAENALLQQDVLTAERQREAAAEQHRHEASA